MLATASMLPHLRIAQQRLRSFAGSRLTRLAIQPTLAEGGAAQPNICASSKGAVSKDRWANQRSVRQLATRLRSNR